MVSIARMEKGDKIREYKIEIKGILTVFWHSVKVMTSFTSHIERNMINGSFYDFFMYKFDYINIFPMCIRVGVSNLD